MTWWPRTSDLARPPGRLGRPSATTRTSVPGIGPPGGRGDDLGRVAAAAHRDDAAGLGESVRGEDGGDVQFAAQPFDEPERDDGRAGDDQAQRRRGRGWSRWGWSSSDWWRVGGPGRTEIRSAATLARTVSTLNTGCGTIVAPAHQAGDDPGLVAEGVEERVHDQVAVALAQSGELAPHVVAAQGLGVGDDGALGAAGGAGGEDDVRGRLGADRLRALADRLGRYGVPARQEVLPGAEGARGRPRRGRPTCSRLAAAPAAGPGPSALPRRRAAGRRRRRCRGRCR